MHREVTKRILLIIDGSHYLYRAYYGVPETAKLHNGLQVNAVYGFMSYLRKAVSFVEPTHICVIFDSETGITGKVQENSSYKANRDYSDTEIYKQLPLIKKLLKYLKISYIEPPDQEADDYIGSLAEYASNHEFIVTIFSNDADFLQLLKKGIQVLRVGSKSLEVVNEESFVNLYGFDPSKYVDYLTLKGDSSDNIRGIKGIGPKTSQGLIKEYGSVDNLLSNLNNITGKTYEVLLNSKDIITENQKLLKINTSVLNINKHIEGFAIKADNLVAESTNYLLSNIGINTN